jgi:O-antigen biosynthesis protein
MKESIKLIAFYLPQFHRIPENDLWWGEGFTEWANVRKAKPNFEGHYQPRYPGELGYYDLKDIEIQKKQIGLAKEFGIHGFCYYYYWFSGKRLLERPLDQFLENSELDFPFCICWANENWTRRWDGQENEILIGQNHTDEDYHKFIRDVAPILQDKRYIRINGKPLLIVYRASLLPSPAQAAEIWRNECIKLGIGEIYLAAVQSFDIQDPRPFSFDAAIEFPPFFSPPIYADRSSLNIINPDFCGSIQDYRVTATLKMLETPPDFVKFRTIMPSWDNTARRQNNGYIYINSTPATYKKWLKKAIQYTKTHLPAGQQYIFINAWNEWAEGAYLEPDEHYGRGYLRATKEALEINPKKEIVSQTCEEEIDDLNFLVETLHDQVSKIEAERDAVLADRAARLAEKAAQLAAIYSSRTWRLGLWLHRVRLWIAPPKGIRARIGVVILSMARKMIKK